MTGTEGQRLAEFATAVRESTNKRLRQVAKGFEGWRPDDEAMGFADLAQHLIDCDEWLLEKLKDPGLDTMPPMVAKVTLEDRAHFLHLIEDLAQTGRKRSDQLRSLSEEDLSRVVSDKRFGPEVTLWWVIVRGNLDHEIHHRGQIAAYLRMVAAQE
jgi:uncharacterized damage-inducible protein DinB